MKDMTFKRGPYELLVRHHADRKAPMLSYINRSVAHPSIKLLGYLKGDEEAQVLQDILAVFLTGQTADKALRDG